MAVTSQNPARRPPWWRPAFFFEGTGVGSDTPDAAGNVSKGGLSVPGDAETGSPPGHRLLRPAGFAVVQGSTFEVLPVSVHRPALVTSLPLPGALRVLRHRAPDYQWGA